MKKNSNLKAYQRKDNTSLFQQIDFPASVVSSFTINNVLYVSRNLFPNRNIITYGVSDISKIKPSNNYDDISLLRFASKYNIPNIGIEKIKNQNASFRINPPEPPGFEGGGEPCAVAVHHCNNGSTTATSCQPFDGGCRTPVSCAYSATLNKFQLNDMPNEYNTFQNNLVENQLYNFKDWLLTESTGTFYHDSYYSMSDHFKETLDFELLNDLATASFDMKVFVSAILNNDPNYVLNQTSFNKFVSIAQKSALKSESIVYKDLVNELITEVQVYKSKNTLQIKSLASEEISFQ
ncbi:hypothetical protein C9994_01110 [Marivirga lumbricoides]|uniref:Uncharacterized protein n=1 Tax=Marivirga lumbricoides TaxID=1046115 RepID=A0A2T4DVX0_9BACT|nr:hypothetical protein C9994_01110 [Marivirga lumbricoides]